MPSELTGAPVSAADPPGTVRWARGWSAAVRTPSGVHFASLAVSFVALLVIGRDQWFFGDDWAILVPRLDDDVLLPHVGHWNLIPAVVFPFVREWLGLSSHLPFLALAIAAHLTVSHLMWRVLNRVGVAPWLATLLGILVMLFGGGAENIFWAFQFGFMGAVAVGLSVVLLLDRPRVNVLAVILLSVSAPMFSGTALPLLAGAAVVGWMRHGVVKTLLLFLPTAVVYLSWYVIFARGVSAFPTGISDLVGVRNAVVYAGAMYSAGLGNGLPWIGLGIIPAVAAAVWFVATVRNGIITRATMAYALIISSVVFVGLTTYSRMGLGIYSAIVERYAYVTLVLLLPALGLILTGIVARGRIPTILTTSFVAVLVGFNVVILVVNASTQAAREQGSRLLIAAAIELVIDDPEAARSNTTIVDPQWSPDLAVSDMAELYERGQLVRPE